MARLRNSVFVLFSVACVTQVLAGPQYMVAIPAVIEAGAETKFCISVLKPNETLAVAITLVCDEGNRTLLSKSCSEGFHECIDFKVPPVENQKVYKFEVELKGDTFYSKEVRKVMVKAYQPMTFIQTDKPIYLPGQTVNFRVVTLDTMLRPTHRLFDLIEVEDTGDNRVAQWLNTTANGSILQLSYSLNPEAQEGTYQIIVSFGEDKVYHSFTVEKYVLPKFDVTVTAADTICAEQEKIEAEICAKYTYGQPVLGNVKVKFCRPLSRYYIPVISLDLEAAPLPPEMPCHEETKEMGRDGCAAFTVKMSTFSQIGSKILQDYIDVIAEVEEEGTGITRLSMKRPEISYMTGKLEFMDTPKVYHKGKDLEGRVTAAHFNKTPMANTVVYLFKGSRWSAELLQNVTTDVEGMASFSLSTAEFSGDITLHVSSAPALTHSEYRTPYIESGEHRLTMFQLASADIKEVSSLEVVRKDDPLSCDTEQLISIKYSVIGESEGPMTLIYLALARGAIIKQGFSHIMIENLPVTEGGAVFSLNMAPEMAPHVQVLAYAILPSETVIAHSADFSVEKCFYNKVSLEFDPSRAVPGEDTTMKLTAKPDSLCGVNVVDKSVLIKRPGNPLTADKIFDMLPVTKLSHTPYEVFDQVPCLPVRQRRYILPYPTDKNDAYRVFENVGVKMATNLFIRLPECLSFRGRQYHQGHAGIAYDHVPMARMETRLLSSPVALGGAAGPIPNSDPIIETVRTFFPETWIWDLVAVGSSGTKDVSVTVPDTITTWESEAFCLSSQGFGLAPPKEITVFQPFFLDLTMPYSIVRGEHFELKATVFSYLSSCIMVAIIPKLSSDYLLTPLSGDKYTSCLCSNERLTVSWNMTAKTLGVVNVSLTAEAVESHTSCNNEIVQVPSRGRIDTVTRSLIIKAEGTEVTKTQNVLLCPKGEPLMEETELALPENVIQGSARASISVLGDILGRALKNLNGLLRMPYGCGEQNMALLAPNIYILNYLQNTRQLTQAISVKSNNFLSSGYQRQLNYKHIDGAYSTFGSGTGNTWLTAFVLRALAKAQSFVYIDPKVLESSKTWLVEKQRENGCFQQSGKLFNNRMKGGVSDEVTLTAYITAAFLEINSSTDDPVVKKSLSCLKESINDVSNTYSTALRAYTFTLAGDMEARAHLLQHLDSVALKQGGFLHWCQKSAETSSSLAVEISAYVMMAKLGVSPTAEDLGYASGIVRWLTRQQNSYGGFSSTQDTVVALQALALYSSLVFSPGGSSSVMVQSPSGQLAFDVNNDNKLLYQEQALTDVTGKYSVKVKGNACASIQLNLNYNIPVPTVESPFKIEFVTEADCGGNKVQMLLKCLYQGKEESTNMVILDIKILSGFVPDPESVKRLKGSVLVDRVEEKEDHVLVYIQELPKDVPINYMLNLVKQQPVQNLRPAVVRLYDYYQPSDQVEAEYSHPCSTD